MSKYTTRTKRLSFYACEVIILQDPRFGRTSSDGTPPDAVAIKSKFLYETRAPVY
jgi:hypothetical protein